MESKSQSSSSKHSLESGYNSKDWLPKEFILNLTPILWILYNFSLGNKALIKNSILDIS